MLGAGGLPDAHPAARSRLNPEGSTMNVPLPFFSLRRTTRPGWLVLFVGLVCGCGLSTSRAAENDYRLPENPAELLRVDDEMRAFFAARVSRHASLERKLDAIMEAILGPSGLRFRYKPTGVYDVREAFRRRSGNCVTYAMLFVAVAREFRIPAVFNEVRVDPRWGRIGGLVIERRHLNVWVATPTGGYEIDLNLTNDLRARRIGHAVVGDARALACSYTNAGVFRLAAGDRPAALALLERAVAVDPTCAHAWDNLGGAWMLAGEGERARGCYERALKLDPEAMVAISALAGLHRAAGRLELAAAYERRALHYRERNPYFLLGCAREDLADGRCESARRRLLRAVGIKADEPDFYRALLEVARRAGDERDAERWRRRLARLETPLVAVTP